VSPLTGGVTSRAYFRSIGTLVRIYRYRPISKTILNRDNDMSYQKARLRYYIPAIECYGRSLE